MKQISKQDIKTALKDRWWVGLVITNIVIGLIVAVVIVVAIEPRETQVITHYSAFGVSNFYRSSWTQLLNYGLLELIVVAAHSLLSLKLMHIERRDLALALLWATIGLSLVVLTYALSIIKIAALG